MSTRTAILSLLVFLLFQPQANAQGGELSAIIAESMSRYSECSTFLKTCQPTKAACATYICEECTSVGSPAINSCCLQADPLSCFIAGAGRAVSASTAAVSGGSSSSTPVPVSASTTAGSGAAATTASSTNTISTSSSVATSTYAATSAATSATAVTSASTSASTSATASSNMAPHTQNWSLINGVACTAAMITLLFGYIMLA